MRRYAAVLAGYIMLNVIFAVLAGAADFGDVPKDHWAREEIRYVTDRGIFLGQTRETFAPDSEMTRGQMAMVLYRLAGLPETEAEMDYGDVGPETYCYDAVRWAKENDIFPLAWAASDILTPDENITRGEFAAMLRNYDCAQGCAAATAEAAENPFTDMDGVTGEIRDAVLGWAYPKGILRGTTPTTMNPNGTLKRAHAAAMLCRYDRGMDAAVTVPLTADGDSADSETEAFVTEETAEPEEEEAAGAETAEPQPANATSSPENTAERDTERSPYRKEREEMVRLVNEARLRSGVQAVSISEVLMDAAQTYAETMPRDHDPKLEAEILHQHGCAHAVTCNLFRASGYADSAIPETAVRGWEQSRSHYLAMTNEAWDSCGVGLYYDEAAKSWYAVLFTGDCALIGALLGNAHR